MNPMVSCLCCTFGRPELLNEAIHSFLIQDYDGPKELIILNTYTDQQLEYWSKDVRVFNVPTRPKTMGECRNLCANQAEGELFLVWDDDDIYLPSYISMMVRLLNGRQWCKPQWRYNARKFQISDLEKSACHQIIYRAKAWKAVGYYNHVDSGEDYEFVRKLREVEPNEAVPHDWRQTQFIYGWDNGVHHLSGDKRRHGYANSKKAVDRGIRLGRAQRGKIPLRPKWRRDYIEQATKFIQSHEKSDLDYHYHPERQP